MNGLNIDFETGPVGGLKLNLDYFCWSTHRYFTINIKI